MIDNDNTAEQLKCREAFEKWYANRYGEYQPNNLKDATWHAWKAAKTTDVQTSSTVSEVETLRAAQARDVMPLIGSLLDSFELLANDLKTDPDLKELVRGLHAIERAMLAAEPNDERIDQVSQQEVNGIPVPVTIDRTHANRAYVTLGFADSSFCTDFIKAAERGFRPSYTRADSGEVMDADCQVLPKGWRIEVRDNGRTKGLCVFSPDGCFAVDGNTDHKSDIRQHVIDLLDAALAGKRGE